MWCLRCPLFPVCGECSGAVVGIVDCEMLTQPDQGGVAPQKAGAKTVERAEVEFAGAGDERLNAMPHFICGFVGKREGDNLSGRDALLRQIRNPVRDHPGFSTTGAGKDQ